jgi:tellurite methyltransferase
MSNWDERYLKSEQISDEPAPLIVSVAQWLTAGQALDIACGAGRNAIFLAERGWKVTAVDSSQTGIELAGKRATARNVALDLRVADLERDEFRIEPDYYDLICNFYYLQRDLFPQIRAGVRHGAVVVAAIHMVDDSPELKPMNPAYLLKPGELRAEFYGWELLHYLEGSSSANERKRAEIVARK